MRLEEWKVTTTLSMLGTLGKLTPALIALVIRKVLVGSLNLAYLDALSAGLPLCLQRMSLSGSIAPKRTVIYVAISLESNAVHIWLGIKICKHIKVWYWYLLSVSRHESLRCWCWCPPWAVGS